jgi:toxin YhaV
MSASQLAPLTINGWSIFAHPLFIAQIEALTRQVEALKKRDPAGYAKKNASKRLTAISKLAFEVIPQDPTRPEYRQGNTLGDEHRHWFRAKFFQQYRLFFRYHAPSKVIIYA